MTTLERIPVVGTETPTHRRRVAESINMLNRQSTIGALLYPQTAAETSAAVTPTNYAYPPGNILRYGADSTGATVSTTAIQAAIDVSGESGVLVVIPEGTYLTRQLTVPSNVEIYGAGRLSLLKRDPAWTGTNNNIFLVGDETAAVSCVTFMNFAVDLNGADSFGRIIQLGQQDVTGTVYTASQIRILDMRFTDSNPDLVANDKWAIIWRANLRDIWVERCVSDGDMQLTAGGTDEYRNVNILYNIATDCDANGIAMSAGRDDSVVDGLKVIGNYVEANGLCYYFGPDNIYSANTNMSWKNIEVSHNTAKTLSGGSVTTWMGFYFNAPPEAMAAVSGTGNIVECLDTLDSQIGIRFDDANSYGGNAISDRVTLSGGNIKGCRYGIDIASGGTLSFTGLGIDGCTDGIYVRNAVKANITGGYIRGGTRAVNVANGEVLITGVDAAGGSGQTGSSSGRLSLTPGDGQTAKVFATGNKFTDGVSGTSIYGVRGAATGTGVTELHLINNDLRNNDGPIDNITPDVAHGNLGYVTENGGTSAAISSGGTIAHGLAGTPTVFHVTPTAAATDVYVTADGTNLTVTFGGGGSVAFSWEAKLDMTQP